METFYYKQSIELLKGLADFSTVGGRIKYYRLAHDLLQDDLSKITGIDRTTIIRYENNQLIPSLDITTRIATGIGIEPFLIYDDYLAFIASNYVNGKPCVLP